jgi:hypothetical protein
MRVPVYPSDLESQKGFKRIAKVLSRDWTGPHPLNLSLAREILAQAFGYADYHDVTMSAKKCQPGAFAPSEAEVQNAIEQAVIEVGQGNAAVSISPTDLQQLVTSLPLHALIALKRSPAASSLAPSPSASTATDESYLAEQGISHQQPAPKAGAEAVDGSSNRPLLSKSELQSIVRVVEQSGKLRDMALLAFMLSGLRKNEFIELKAGQVSVSAQEFGQPWIALARFKMHKTYDQQEQSRLLHTGFMALPTAAIMQNYLRSEQFRNDDYLFPSRNDPKQPMTDYELHRICEAWSVLAKLKARRLSASSVRRLMFAQRTTPLGFSEMFGHKSHSSTIGYIASLQPKLDGSDT